MAEWLKAHAWKACLLERVTWVRIPLSPPYFQSVTDYEITPKSVGPRKCHPGHFRVCLRHFVRDYVPIHVERRANIRMPHQLLLHGNRSSRGVQPRAIAVAEGMRSELRDSRLHSR